MDTNLQSIVDFSTIEIEYMIAVEVLKEIFGVEVWIWVYSMILLLYFVIAKVS